MQLRKYHGSIHYEYGQFIHMSRSNNQNQYKAKQLYNSI